MDEANCKNKKEKISIFAHPQKSNKRVSFSVCDTFDPFQYTFSAYALRHNLVPKIYPFFTKNYPQIQKVCGTNKIQHKTLSRNMYLWVDEQLNQTCIIFYWKLSQWNQKRKKWIPMKNPFVIFSHPPIRAFKLFRVFVTVQNFF